VSVRNLHSADDALAAFSKTMDVNSNSDAIHIRCFVAAKLFRGNSISSNREYDSRLQALPKQRFSHCQIAWRGDL
jgi:hypothetical protein